MGNLFSMSDTASHVSTTESKLQHDMFAKIPFIPEESKIEFITDVEGDIQYFDRIIKHSKILNLVGTDYDLRLEFQTSNGMLVYGGDVCDRGVGDIRIGSLLIDLKSRYNNRVFFIMGNRDMNKLRLMKELFAKSEEDQFKWQNYKPGEFWAVNSAENWSKNGLQTWRKSLIESKEEKQSKQCSELTVQDMVIRLKWILDKTMGSPKAFEYRKKELHQIYNNLHEQHLDKLVLISYLKSTVPNIDKLKHIMVPKFVSKQQFNSIKHDNFMYKYVMQSHLMVQLGNNLFTHSAFGFEFDYFNRKQLVLIREHITKYTDNPQQWDYMSIHNKLYVGTNVGNRLKHGYYNENVRLLFPLVSNAIESYNAQTKWNIYNYKQIVVNILERLSCQRLFFGHTPVGDMPTALQIGEKWLINGDTGYSGGRGRDEAYANVLITKSEVTVSGNTSPKNQGMSNEKYSFTLGHPVSTIIGTSKPIVTIQEGMLKHDVLIKYVFEEKREKMYLAMYQGAGKYLNDKPDFKSKNFKATFNGHILT
eukprot:18676_1